MLIDDKFLIKVLEQMAADDSHHTDTKSKSQHRSEIRSCIYKVTQQPIAYDIDAVVKQIEEFYPDAEHHGFSGSITDIIEIVRNGGVK